MTTPSRKQLESDLRELEAVSRTRGWAVVEQAIKDDIVLAAIDMANNPSMSEAEMHYRRGAMYAATAFLSVIDRLRVKLENDALLAKGPSPFGPLNNPDATAKGDL